MQLTDAQLSCYQENGYVLLPGLLSAAEVERLKATVPDLLDGPADAVLRNAGDGLPRLVFGPHQRTDAFDLVTRLPRVVEPARQLLGGDVYVHQTKVTLNTPQGGEGWPWHQDYAFWRRRDALPGPQVLSAAVFLDDVTQVNGPLFIVPGSHLGPVLETETGVLDRTAIADVCARQGIDVPLGPAGSVLYFDGKAVHGSSTNISPFHRRILYITYNNTSNIPGAVNEDVPAFVAARDYRAVSSADDAALAFAA